MTKEKSYLKILIDFLITGITISFLVLNNAFFIDALRIIQQLNPSTIMMSFIVYLLLNSAFGYLLIKLIFIIKEGEN